MDDVQARLQAALSGRYVLEAELGHGGMAVVYRALDLKHHRPVAIKVLRPELAAALGPDRFLREIEIAAGLTHPHILSLHDSGEAAGLPYYVMPLVAGESLRDRLARAQALPPEDAIRIAWEVADALHYAHQHGVLHRDIKPDNILLAGDHAVVSDFGIARAVAVAGTEPLTQTGMTVGTPAYMSPEQAAGEPELDARSDIYSLGCVLYEMLTGAPPFAGRSAQAVLAQQRAQPPPPLRATRGAVAPQVEQVIRRALAKDRAARFATAAELRDALHGEVPRARVRSTRRRVAVAILGLAGAATLVFAAPWIWRKGPATDPNLVAVLPFRVSATDSTLRFLREGMLDLLAARLTGEFGPRAVDPRALLSSWRRAAPSASAELSEEATLRVVRGLGAGRVLSGGIVAAPPGIVIQASLAPVRAGRRATPSVASVTGSLDSLARLVDQLVAQLLARESGEAAGRLAALSSTSLPALRAYLDGEANYRQSNYEAAVRAFRQALAIDSTFALAGIGLRNAALWTIASADAVPQGLQAAWTFRNRLSARDREFLGALVGPHYPTLPSYVEQLTGWERVVGQTPDRPEAWFELGEVYLHFAPLFDLDAAPARAAAAFSRAVALDSTLLAPLQHLYQIASIEGDTAAARRLGAVFLARATGGAATLGRWQLALALRDSAALAHTRPALDSLGLDDLVALTFFSQIMSVWGGGLEDAERAADRLWRRATTAAERQVAMSVRHGLALNRGRPAAALRAAASLDPPTRVLDALYWDGDTLAGAAAARALAHAPRDGDLCALEQWRLWHGDTAAATRTIARLRATGGGCAPLLDALRAVVAGDADAARRVARLDSVLRQGPSVDDDLREANLVLSRLRERLGDAVGALVAARRYPFVPSGELYLSSYLRQQARMAVLTGRPDAAISAYGHYLQLRDAPEPAVAPQVAEVRAALARLGPQGAR
jgi:serine/threonine-protein kinase